MAQHKSAEKRIRQSEKRRERNRHYTSLMRTVVKRVRTLTDKNQAEMALKEAVQLLDKLAAKRVIHRNKAANQKLKLTRLVNSLK